MTPRTRGTIRLGAGVLIMADATVRIWHMATDGSRPIDWAILIVDFLVLAVILWLDAPERFHKYKVRRRLSLVHNMMAEGQGLHTSAPRADATDAKAVDAWVIAVRKWIEQTHQTLADHSVAAGMSFDSRRVAPDINWGVVSHMSNAREWYGELLHRLSNLQNIMEKAEVYF
jgi:hypothetical protein